MSEKKIRMHLSLSPKLKVLLKFNEVYDINPLYRASSREINQDFKLNVNGEMSFIKGININENILDNSVSDLYKHNLLGRIARDGKKMNDKSKFLYFISSLGNKIAIEYKNTLKIMFPRILSTKINNDDLNEEDFQKMLLICETVINGNSVDKTTREFAFNLYNRLLHLKGISNLIAEKINSPSF